MIGRTDYSINHLNTDDINLYGSITLKTNQKHLEIKSYRTGFHINSSVRQVRLQSRMWKENNNS